MPFDSFARSLLVSFIRQNFYHWDIEKLRRHQEQRLAHMLRYVSRRSPYYRRLRQDGWDRRLETLPYLRKSEMVEHFDEINTAGLHRDELAAFSIGQEREHRLGLYRGRYSVGLSSGTSGNKLVTVLSSIERWQYGSLLWARCGIPERVRNYRVLFTLRVNNPAFMETRFLGASMVYADYTHSPEMLIRLINEKQLNILAGPPSLLRMLAGLCEKIDHPIDVLISYAEVLDDATRAYLSQTFQAQVAEIYQGAEGFIGSTCREGKLHINEDILLIEAVDSGDGIGHARQVVVTDLYRKTQPFLRYWLNDVLEISSQPCACGSAFRVIERIHGRADDVFYLRGKNGSPCYLFPDYVTRSINQASDAILEFQAIQHQLDQIEIRLVLKPGADQVEIERAITHNLTYWAGRAGGELGRVAFNNNPPERNPNSRKLIRVQRRF
jgi:putative adenylate-forming enzyme